MLQVQGIGRWGGVAAALALGFFLVIGLELCLRFVFDFRAPRLVVELARVEEKFLYAINPEYARRFFSGVSVAGMRMTPHPFVEPRPADALRVILVGGSTVQGYPHPRRLSVSSYVQTMLAEAMPGRSVEVFNMGITAISSFAVARAVEDAMELEPDVVVVYSGHNEIYGVYGSASLSQGGSSIWMKELHYGLMQWGLTSLVRQALSLLNAEGSSPPTSLLRVMSAAGNVEADDTRRNAAEENIRANLSALAQTCKENGVQLVLCTVASNERGFAPTYAEPPMDGEALSVWLALTAGGVEAYAAGRFAAALEAFDDALQQAPYSAWAHFNRGRCLEALGRGQQARRAYRAARDMDPTPWRASSALNEAIRTTARARDVVLVDSEVLFAERSPAAGVGWELMADHVHPTSRGQVLLARGVAEALVGMVAGDAASAAVGRADSVYRTLQGDLPLEQLAVLHDMHILLSEEPMSLGNERHAGELAERADALWGTLSPAEQSAYQRWRQGKGPAILALNAADQLFANRDVERAAQYYRAASLEEPFTPWGDMWATLRWGRSRQALSGGLSESERLAIRAMQERLSLLAHSAGFSPGLAAFFAGYAHYLLGEDGVELLEKSLEDAQVRRLFFYDLLAILCEKLPEQGRAADAERHVRAVTGELGQAEYGRFLLAQLAVHR